MSKTKQRIISHWPTTALIKQSGPRAFILIGTTRRSFHANPHGKVNTLLKESQRHDIEDDKEESAKTH